MTRALVTGATGFLGSQALPRLVERGYEVHATYRSQRPERVPGVSWHRADLLAPDDVDDVVARVRPSRLLHLAWYAEPGSFWSSADNPRWVASTLHLATTFAAAGGSRLVAAGSCAEYDWASGGLLLSEEETPKRPSTLYGTSKHATHEVLAAWGAEVGCSVAWGRIFFAFGPREHPARLVPSVITALLASRPAPCTDGRQRRDFLHSSDVGSAFAALLDSEVTGPVNIGSGRPVAIADVVRRLEQIVGADGLVQLGALQTRPGEPGELTADVSRLRDELGWTPALDLGEALERTVAWWRDNLGGAASLRNSPPKT